MTGTALIAHFDGDPSDLANRFHAAANRYADSPDAPQPTTRSTTCPPSSGNTTTVRTQQRPSEPHNQLSGQQGDAQFVGMLLESRILGTVALTGQPGASVLLGPWWSGHIARLSSSNAAVTRG